MIEINLLFSLSSFLTDEILLTLCVVVGGGGGAKSFPCQLQLCVVDLLFNWGFDNNEF